MTDHDERMGRMVTTNHSGQRSLLLLLAGLALAALLPGRALAGEAAVVKVMASVRESPPRITLDWPRIVNSGGFKIYRKSMEDKAWGAVYATLADDTFTTFVDDNVAVGVGYEYNVETVKSMGDDGKAHGYIYSGIAMPPVESRGKVILLVDNTMVAPLSGEIERLEWDLAGDGWTILRHDVPRSPDWACTNTEVIAIKNIIRNDYQSDSNNVKCVFLLGRVALPKVLGGSPDGHTSSTWLNYDTHYSMPNVDWTGFYGGSSASMKLDVGRVDMSNADESFQLSEVELLRRYLNKHHAFRNRLTAFQTRGVSSGGWWEDQWKMQTWVGRDKWVDDKRFESIEQTPSLWDHAEGLAYGNSVPPSRYASHKYQSVFGMSGGSGAWNYDAGASVLKPSLNSPGANLAHVYSYSPTRFFHWMALGQTLGTSERLATANYALYYHSSPSVHRGLCGDPTLRMHMLAPPSGLTIVGNTLSWAASPDAGTDGFSGYHVYRGASRAGPFTRQTTTPVTGTSWTDPAPSNGIYQVRAIRLETTSVGSYYNNSAGAFSTRGQVGIVPDVRWLSVPEARSANFLVKLSSPPASNVTVTAARTGGDSSITVQSGGSLLFTPATWNLYQPVTLAAARDYDNNGWDNKNTDKPVDGPATITLSSPGLSDVTVGVTEEDLIIETSLTRFTVPENGASSLKVRLSGPPVGNVTVTTMLEKNGGWSLSVQSGASLTFTPANWNEWQSVTIANAASPTRVSTGDTLTLTAPGYRTAEVSVWQGERNASLDVRPDPATGGMVTPNDSAATCVVGEPTTLSAVPNPGYRFTGWVVSFDEAPVTIADPSAPITTIIKHYDHVSGGGLGDVRATFLAGSTGPALITIERDCQSITVPAGGTTNMRIRLSAQPSGTVTVSRRKMKDAAIWVQQSSFTFTTANWSQWQTVTLGCAEHDPGRVPTDHGGGEVSRQDEIEFSGTGLVSSRLHVYEGNKCQLTSWSGIGGVAVTPSGRLVVKKGWAVAITARANTGYRFDRWEVRSGQASFADARSANTTVILDGDATIQAEFARVDAAHPPTCEFESPVGHVAVKAGTNLTLAATAASAALGATVSKVEFYRDGVRLGEDMSAPYSCVWSNVPVGTHTLTARAIDSEGVAGDLVTVWVTATASGVWNSILASGGDEVYDFVTNGFAYRVHKFITPGWMPDTEGFVVSSTGSSGQVEYLVVAGAGGGSGFKNRRSGGGGAGGMLAGSTSVVAQIYPIVVGAGGNGGMGGGDGRNGGNSSLGTIAVAIGGGKGISDANVSGGAGGSGGGNGSYNGFGGSGTPGQGHDGTYGRSNPSSGGGGGGAGGSPAVQSMTGGIGLSSSISGVNATYAGGGNGGSEGNPDGDGATGAANTGNGGGGANNPDSYTYNGGAGGSGIVIVRYVIPAAVCPVIFHANGATGGTVPSAQIKTYGVTLTLAANTGSLVRTGYSFAGWNTAANGTGTDYAVGASYTANVGLTLYAKWTAGSYPVTYDANGASGGAVPEAQVKTHGVSLALAVNTGALVRSGYALGGWNTEASGTGADYVLGSAYTVNAAVTLYAKWLVSGDRAPVIVTPAFASPATVTLPVCTTTVGVVCDANGAGPLRYEWRQISGPGTAAFTSPGTPDSAVTFSAPGTYVLGVAAVNIRGEAVVSEVTVTVNGIAIMSDVCAVSVPEGGTNTLRLKLSAKPSGTVTVTVARVSGETDITVQSGASLIFTTNNWGTYQTVTLAAAEDGDTEDGSASITVSSAGMLGEPVTATEADNDTTLWINATAG
ncbi:MAG: InlB B-repeat-containing protein, partial [Lentisphaerae bacterium]|nr:InlB B-repeat-containing protein [Lentisphaerota bacterium]